MKNWNALVWVINNRSEYAETAQMYLNQLNTASGELIKHEVANFLIGVFGIEWGSRYRIVFNEDTTYNSKGETYDNVGLTVLTETGSMEFQLNLNEEPDDDDDFTFITFDDLCSNRVTIEKVSN